MSADVPLQGKDSASVVSFVPEHIDMCSTCGYGAPREGYPCYRCGQVGTVRFLPSSDVVPREVAERLAEALAVTGHLAEVDTEHWTGDHSTALNEALKALAEFRAVFPKAEEA